MSCDIPTTTFNDGNTIPILGYGTWKSDPGKVTQGVKDAIDAGYRMIDCAFIYGNEKEVGEGIKAKIDDGTVRREDLFITSKIWNTYHRRDLVLPALKKSLDLLQVDYLDMYMIHWPMSYKDGDVTFPRDDKGQVLYSSSSYTDTWQGLEDVAEEGLVKSIGVCNFNTKQVENVLKICRIKPVTNQVECHPYLNQIRMKAFIEEKGMLMMGYSPLGSGDRPWKTKDDPVLLEDPKLKEIASKYGKSVAQICIRYQIDRGVILFPKSVTKSRIIANKDVFDFELTEEDMKKINTLDRGMRFVTHDWDKPNKDWPFHIDL